MTEAEPAYLLEDMSQRLRRLEERMDSLEARTGQRIADVIFEHGTFKHRLKKLLSMCTSDIGVLYDQTSILATVAKVQAAATAATLTTIGVLVYKGKKKSNP